MTQLLSDSKVSSMVLGGGSNESNYEYGYTSVKTTPGAGITLAKSPKAITICEVYRPGSSSNQIHTGAHLINHANYSGTIYGVTVAYTEATHNFTMVQYTSYATNAFWTAIE